MNTNFLYPLRQSLAIVAVGALVLACADSAPLAPNRQPALSPQLALTTPDKAQTIATLRRVTARYHDLNAAIADDFVFLHGCEVRGDEGPVGMVYVHPGRLFDGVINPESPDALIYEPNSTGIPQLVGVELAVPYALWTGQNPPEFLGAAFQSEDEFGVFGLHVWAWRENPEGLFAETNPKVSCGEE